MPTKLPKAPPGRLIGYARVSTEEQGTDPQLDELRAPAAPPCSRSTPPAQTGCSPAARDPPRRNPGRGPARSPRPLGQPSPRGHRAARGRRRAFPQPARPDRHHDAAGHVLAAGAGRRRPARTGADCRAHQAGLRAVVVSPRQSRPIWTASCVQRQSRWWRPSDVVWTSTRIQSVVMQNASRQQSGFSQDDVKMQSGCAQNAAS